MRGPATYTTFLRAGLHQFVLEVFSSGSPDGAFSDLTVAGPGGAGVTFAHDPAGPCNADCQICKGGGLAYCDTCFGNGPFAGVCISPLIV